MPSSSERSLESLLRDYVAQELGRLHVSAPGEIISYDPTTQTCSVRLATSVLVGDTEIPAPVLDDVPVGFPRAGGFSVLLPVAPGDAVAVHFTDRSMDGWRGGSFDPPSDPRTHSMTDAFVSLDGVQPDGRLSASAVAAHAAGDLVLVRDGGAGLAVKGNGDVVLGDVAGGAAARALASDPLVQAQLKLLPPLLSQLTSAIAALNAAAAAISVVPTVAAVPAAAAAVAAAAAPVAAAVSAVAAFQSWPATTSTTKARAV